MDMANHHHAYVSTPPATEARRAEALEELRAIHREIAKLNETLDTFAHVLLNSKFPFGRPTDKWSRR